MLIKTSGLARPLVSTSLVVLLAGCSTLGMDYAQPQITLSSAYAQKGSAGPAVTAETRWWGAFGDKMLDSLIEEGLAQNLTVLQALEKIETARASARVNGVAYDPSVNGSISASASGVFDNAGSVTHSRSASIDASWEVDFFGKASRNKAVQRANIDAAVEGANEARLTLIGDIARTYVNIRTYQRRLVLAKASLHTQQETTGVVQKRYEAGASTALAVAQSQGQSQTTAASIPSLEVALQQSINALAVLLGKEPAALKGRLGGTGPIPTVKKGIGAGIPADLLRNRPDVREAERSLAAAVAQIGISEAALYPSLSLGGTLSTTGDVSSWSFLPTISLPIFNRDKLTGSVDLSKSNAKSAYLSYRATVLSAVQDVEDALVAYSKERTRRQALAAAVASYAKAQELSQSLYKAGSADYSDVLTSQASLQSAQDALAQSDATLATAYVTLAKALGGGWAVNMSTAVARK